MDTSKFMELFSSSDKDAGDFGASKEAVRRSLDEKDNRYYYDISGDGTTYYRSGARNGVGFASCTVTLQPDGLATVRATSLMVPAPYESAMRKLSRSWNTRFKLRGFKVEDGRLVFESAPFDPVSSRFDANEACDLALSTVNHYASAVLALEAGTEPWDLLDLYEEEHGDDDDGDDGGENAPTLDEVRDLLKSMRSKPRTQTA
jgi:hypothetical protein